MARFAVSAIGRDNDTLPGGESISLDDERQAELTRRNRCVRGRGVVARRDTAPSECRDAP